MCCDDERPNPAAVNELDREEICRLIQEGFTSGMIISDGWRLSWNLTTDKFKD